MFKEACRLLILWGLSHFYFNIFTFTFSLSHFHFHIFTFTVTHSHFHTITFNKLDQVAKGGVERHADSSYFGGLDTLEEEDKDNNKDNNNVDK